MSTTATPVVPAVHVEWLKRIGRAIWAGAKDVAGLLANPQVQKIEQQAANVAELLLPTYAPLITEFQNVAGRIFQQSVVAETSLTNISTAGSQKLAAVVAEVGPELDAWVANNFPGSAKISAEVKAGLVTAIVNLQKAITVPAAPSGAVPAPSAAPVAPVAPNTAAK